MSEQPPRPRADASVGMLSAELGVQAAAFLGQEVALAKAELRANARKAVRGSIPLAAAAVLGGSAWLAALAAAILGISVALPAWAAALIIAAGLAAVGGLLALLAGRRLARVPAGLPLTAETLRQGMHDVAHRARR